MKFHLDFQPADPGFRLRHDQLVMLEGSCFSENIQNKLADAGFTSKGNFFGISFNPLSIFNQLESAVSNSGPDPALYIQLDHKWLSFQTHSSLQGDSSAELEMMLKKAQSDTRNCLQAASCIFITPGTAWYYRHHSTGKVVNNCHRQPQATFSKHLASVQEITQTGLDCIRALKSLNADLKIIFTISPVKHLRDGVEENFLSKSTLRLAIHEICRQQAECSYFPSYELIADDLRDYRFYEADLAHPNQSAIDYVWERFSQTFFSEQTAKLALLFEDRARALRHRHSGNEGDAKFRQHLQQLEDRIRAAGGKI